MKRVLLYLLIVGLLALTATTASARFFRRASSCGVSYQSCAPTYYSAPVYSAPYVAPVYTPPAVTVNVLPSVNSPDFDTEALAYAKYQDTIVHREKVLAALAGRGGYGFQYNSGYSYTPQGNTQLGYSFKDRLEFYTTTDLNAMAQQIARTTQGVLQLAGVQSQAQIDFVGGVGSSQARVAEILAKGAAAERVLRAAEAAASSRTVTGSTIPVPREGPMPPATDPAPQPPTGTDGTQYRALWQASAQQRCAACHVGKDSKGGFDVSTYLTLSKVQRHKVIGRLVTDDLDKRMPRTGDGKVGEQVPENELLAWHLAK